MQVNDIFYEKDLIRYAPFANSNNLTIIDLEPDENGRRFQVVEIPPLAAKELAQIEIEELKSWFDNDYTYKEQKYRRLIALGKTDDDGIDAQTKLSGLYQEAETKRARIQELELLLN